VAAYQAEGILTDYVTRDPEEATGVALIAVASDGENSITVASGSNMRLMPQQIEAAVRVFEEASVLVMQLEVPVDTVLAAARLARSKGVRVVLNPAPAQPLPVELLHLVDVITPNRIELAQLIGASESAIRTMTDEQLAKAALGLGPSGAVITLGAEGALAAGSWGWVRVPAFLVKPLDTTAAGDAFNAGLAVALSRGGMSLEQAARYASACGALATTKMGAQPSLPDAAAVDALMAGR